MITTYTCKNGVRIVYESMHYVRSVSIGIWVNVGSRDERASENGMTHFIEHMLFKGTTSRTARQIAEEFDRIGGHLNAFTSKEQTCYYATVLDHHAEQAITILADMFFHSTFDQVELDKERQVVLEEILMVEDTPDDDVHEQLWDVMYPDHPVGRPILGTEETLETFTSDKIRRFMHENYRPEEIVVSVAGNISPKLILHIEKLFERYELDHKRCKEKAGIPMFHEGSKRKAKETEQSHLALGFPGLSLMDPSIYSFVVFNNIVGGSMSSRLFQEIREDQALAYSIFSYHTSYIDAGAFVIYGGTSNEQLPALRGAIDQSLEVIRQQGVTKLEIEYAKEQMKSSIILGMESSSGRMNRNGKNELVFRKHRSEEELLQEIEKVSFDSVMTVMQNTITKSPSMAIIGPTKGS